MEEQFSKATTLIAAASRILLTTHERTDGDDLGTVLALASHLISQGKQITLAIKGGVPSQLKFLPNSELVVEDIDHENFDLLIISGCSNLERSGNEKIINLRIPIINIDHHGDNSNYGTINLVDSAKSAVAELTYDLFIWAGWEITPAVANCLMTGIFTDTGSFMHSNTQSSTLAASAELMKHGAHTHTIASHTYKGKDIAALRAWGKALDNAYYNPKNKIIYSVLTSEDLDNLGNIPQATFEGLVETLNKVPEAKYALFLKQDGQLIKGSLRSESYKGVNVNKIAKIFGGGGHALASGFSLIGKLVRDETGQWQVV